MRAMPWTTQRSSTFAPLIRPYVARPMTRSNASTTAAIVAGTIYEAHALRKERERDE